MNPSNENENFLFKGVCELNLYLNEFEIKCYTGSDFNLANEYFCTLKIQKQ